MSRKIHRFPKRLLSLLLTLCLLASVFAATLLTAFAAPPLPAANSQPRHVVCTELSAAASLYYTGEYSYEALSALPGAEDASDSWAVTQNNPLYTALQTLMSETQTFQGSYSGSAAGSLLYYWNRTDAVNGEDHYHMFYADVDPQGYTLNREHVWPKSRASFYQKFGGADVHHLRPSVSSLNSAKSNHRFGNIVGYHEGYTEGYVGGEACYWVLASEDLFECKDEVKGDVARILLYVYVRWGQPNLYSKVDADKLPPLDPDDNADNGDPVVESLDTLLEWCALDPVDTWEMERNDLTEEVQGNRNVFIDYPELAWRMFGLEIPAGMQTPSAVPGCPHEWALSDAQEPTCLEDGYETYTCALCTETYTKPLPALGHADADNDGFCDRCELQLTIPVDFLLTDTLAAGDHLVIYHPKSDTVMGTEPLGTTLAPASCGVLDGVLHPSIEAAVCEVETPDSLADGQFLLRGRAGYLTSVSIGGGVSFTQTPNDYSVWYLEAGSSADTVRISSAKGKYYSGQATGLEYYSEAYTTYSKGSGDAFQFQLYVRPDHLWDEGVETTPGETLYTCTLCGATKTVEQDPCADGHDWAEPTYEWREDFAEVTATRVCKRDENHVETETVQTAREITKPATVDETGEITYTATFENEAFATQTKTEEIPKLEPADPCADGHDWAEPTYEWREDFAEVTATRVCKRDENHVETETVQTAREITKPATVDETGEITYTATFENEAFATQTKTEAIPKLEPTLENPFEDVEEGKFFYDAVLWAVNHEPQITNGTDATHFAPGAECTRGQVVTFLWRAKGCPEPASLLEGGAERSEAEGVVNPFTDIAEGSYYYKAVLWAVENEITKGTSATTFGPADVCTRGQVVTFLWRTAGSPDPNAPEIVIVSNDNETPIIPFNPDSGDAECPFEDVVEGAYYYDAMLWAVANEITNGTSATTFSPGATCTRGQVVTFLYRALAE